MSARAPAASYLHEGFDVASWLATTDHKRIAWLYIAGITMFFVIRTALRRQAEDEGLVA